MALSNYWKEFIHYTTTTMVDRSHSNPYVATFSTGGSGLSFGAIKMIAGVMEMPERFYMTCL